MVKIIHMEPSYDDLAFEPAMTWDEFKEQVAKFAHEKHLDLFYFSAKAEVVIGKLWRLSLDQHGSIWVSYVDHEGEDRWVHLADDRTYNQMLKVMESIYDKN